MTLSVGATACGRSIDPRDVVMDFAEAMDNQDRTAVASLTCAEEQKNIPEAMQFFASYYFSISDTGDVTPGRPGEVEVVAFVTSPLGNAPLPVEVVFEGAWMVCQRW